MPQNDQIEICEFCDAPKDVGKPCAYCFNPEDYPELSKTGVPEIHV